jgi:hypothetical protein
MIRKIAITSLFPLAIWGCRRSFVEREVPLKLENDKFVASVCLGASKANWAILTRGFDSETGDKIVILATDHPVKIITFVGNGIRTKAIERTIHCRILLYLKNDANLSFSFFTQNIHSKSLTLTYSDGY